MFQVSSYLLFSVKLSKETKENTQLENAIKNEATKDLVTLQTKSFVWKNENIEWLKYIL